MLGLQHRHLRWRAQSWPGQGELHRAPPPGRFPISEAILVSWSGMVHAALHGLSWWKPSSPVGVFADGGRDESGLAMKNVNDSFKFFSKLQPQNYFYIRRRELIG